MDDNNLKLLQVYHFDKKERLGSKTDGGYVIAVLDGGYDCYISAGIANEESFSRDFINKYEMNRDNSYAFDGTIADYPYSYTDKITFYRKNIGCLNNQSTTNLKHLCDKYDNIFLKIDIEGGEYPWLASMDEDDLDKFKQIAIEFHGITNDTFDCVNADKMRCLRKLAKTHFIVHAHGNNNGYVVNGIPDVIELTYVNKKYFNGIQPDLNCLELPSLNLDFPNADFRGDYDLNFYPFVKKSV